MWAPALICIFGSCRGRVQGQDQSSEGHRLIHLLLLTLETRYYTALTIRHNYIEGRSLITATWFVSFAPELASQSLLLIDIPATAVQCSGFLFRRLCLSRLVFCISKFARIAACHRGQPGHVQGGANMTKHVQVQVINLEEPLKFLKINSALATQ